MKFAVCLIVSCLVVYASCAKETKWGNTNPNFGVRDIGTENVNVPSTIWSVKTHRFTFPRVPLQVPIAGIKHVDYKSHPVTVKILSGGVGYLNATIEITSQKGHGINSVFTFYAK